MKLQSVSVILVLGVMGLAGMANASCLVRNSTTTDQYWYQCFRSNDYLADLKRAPVDVYGHAVSNSKIRVIRNGSYARLGRNLQRLAVVYCDVEEIEDNAFQGLTNLRSLALMGNKLEIIKSAWVAGLPNLKAATFENNRIKHVENNFFATLPSMYTLDISGNQLTCLPTPFFGNFQVKEFYFRHNRLTSKCRILVSDWLMNADIWGDYRWQNQHEFNAYNMDPPYDLAKICETKLPRSRFDDEFLNKCAEETSRQLLPADGDYTVGQVCEFLKGKPSPFLDCTK